MAGMLIVLLLAVGGFSAVKVNSLGHEIEGIAERDMPLAQIVGGVEVRQLEQSIEFERAVRFGERMFSDRHAEELFFKNKELFEEFSAEATELIKRGEELAAEAIESARTAADVEEFEKILHEFEGVETAHESFEHAAEAIFAKLEAGDTTNIEAEIEAVEHSEDALNKQLVEMTEQIQHFTEAALLKAEADEKTTLTLIMALSAGALSSDWSRRSSWPAASPCRSAT